jgi:integrase
MWLATGELAGLETEDFKGSRGALSDRRPGWQREAHRTVPVPAWAKRAVDEWTAAAGIKGVIFKRVNRMGKIWGDRITAKAIWHVVKAAACRHHEPCSPRLAPDLRAIVPFGGR